MRYLDESGFSLSLPPTSTWTRKGSSYQHRVPTRWGSEGRINLIGTLKWDEGGERLEYATLEGSCRGTEVIAYLDALAKETANNSEEIVVVMDNASSHTAGAVREREEAWKQRGLRLHRLPVYCPHLNLIEGVWRRIKHFLMPRRFYNSKSELREAVLQALCLLGAVEIHCQLGDT